MLVVFEAEAPLVGRVRDILGEDGHGHEFRLHRLAGRSVLEVRGALAPEAESQVRSVPGVVDVLCGPDARWLSAARVAASRTRVHVAPGLSVGGPEFVVAAGPCAVENPDVLADTADAVAYAGASILRGGAFKPRTHPLSFQGLGAPGLALLADTGTFTGLPVVTEVLDPRQVEAVAVHADVLQIGARNMHNYELLKEVGKAARPVLLKRGLAATVEEWFGAAEYVLREGNPDVILCERGIRTFETATRFTLDLSAVALVKRRSHLPVIVDPSHGTGEAALVRPMALAAAAAGADGLLIDVHSDPAAALCDGAQALDPTEFIRLMTDLRRVLDAVDRPLSAPARPRLAEGSAR